MIRKSIAWQIAGPIALLLAFSGCGYLAAAISQPSAVVQPDYRTAEQIENLQRHPELADYLQLAAVPQNDLWHYSASVSRTGFSIQFKHSIPFVVKRTTKRGVAEPSPPPWSEPTPIPGSGRPFVLRPLIPSKPDPPN